MDAIWSFLTRLGPVAWVFLMIIVVTICSSIVRIYRIRMRHQERMEMIARGMNPYVSAGKDDDADD